MATTHGGDRKSENQEPNSALDKKSAADALNVSKTSVGVATKIKHASPKLFDRVSAGEITLHAAEKIVDEKRAAKEPVVDETGCSIPEEMHELWQRRGEVEEMISDLTRIVNRLIKGQKEKDQLFSRVTFSDAIAKLEFARMEISQTELYAVCGTCQGRGRKSCALCKGRGFNSKNVWKTCIPEEVKAIRAKAVKK